MIERVALVLAALLLPTRAHAASLAETVMAGLAGQPSREAGFTEEKRLASLTEPLVSRGRLVFVRPARLEKITQTPKPELLVINGETITVTADGQAARTVSLDEHPALRALADTLRATLAGDLATLRRIYDIEEQGTPDAWRLLLVPIRPAMRRALARVTLDGGGDGDGELRRIVIQQANGDEQRLTVTKLP